MRFFLRLSPADLITTIGIGLGFSSLFYAPYNTDISSGLILIAVIMDALDGMVARKIGSSDDGMIYDTLGDLVSFSVAPSYLLYNSLSMFPISIKIILSMLVLLTSIIHLRNYISSDSCYGCQTTVSAIIICYAVYLNDPIALSVVSVIFSILMTIDVEYPEDMDNRLKMTLGIILFLSVFLNYYEIFRPDIVNYPIVLIILLYGIFTPYNSS